MNWPLALHHDDARRIHRATVLIVTRQIKPGTYDVADALIVRQNERRRKIGQEDIADATIATIIITTIEERQLIDLDLRTVRAAGWKTQRDFYEEWLRRRGEIDPYRTVKVCAYSLTERLRLLHKRVARGYTSNSAEAAAGEPEALSASDLAKLCQRARERHDQRTRAQREATPLADRVLELQRRSDTGDRQAQRHLFMIAKHVDAADDRKARNVRPEREGQPF